MCDLVELNDLEYRDDKRDFVQPLKKHIPLKLNLSCVNTPSSINGKFKNIQLKRETINDNDDVESNGPPSKLQKLNGIQVNVTKSDSSNSLILNGTTKFKKEPTHKVEKLNWNFKITNVGKKIDEPNLFCCDFCKAPILIYGRMIPCKHVFCVKCAHENSTRCPKPYCQQDVERIEEVNYKQIFVCTYGKSTANSQLEYPQTPSKITCARSYMSARDLQAHINHRHLVLPQLNTSQEQQLRGNHVQFNTQSLLPLPQKLTSNGFSTNGY